MAKINNSLSKGVISAIFRELDRENIPYAVLRNYDTLPEKSPQGSDIDILIAQDAQKAYEHILKKAIQENKAFILSKTAHYNCFSCLIYQRKPFHLITWLDAFTIIATKGFIWMDSNLLLKERIRHKKGFYILSPGMEAATLFLKDILNGQPVKERYRLKIQRLIKHNEATFVRMLSAYFSKKTAQEMLQICLDGKWDDAFHCRRRWRRTLILTAFQREPIKQLFRSLSFPWGYFKERIRFRKGIFIAVIGPDGAGKTTICQNLQKRIKCFFLKKIYYHHGQFGFFPELGKIYNRLLTFWRPLINKDTASLPKKAGKIRAFIHLIYYGLECFLAWPWVLWAKARGNIFIFDRYFYDFAATKRLQKLFLAIAKIIPRPDLVFIVKARPEQIYKRKQELTIDEIKNQLTTFQDSWLSKLSRCIMINTEQPLEISLNKIEDELLKLLQQ